MKTSIFSKYTVAAALIAAVVMSGCAKKNTSSVRTAGRGVPEGAQQLMNNNNGTSCTQSQMGKIFDPNASPQFESQVKGFVSATLDPRNLGTISGDINAKTGIDFNGNFQFDPQGNLIPASSTVYIKIVDSYVYEKPNGQSPPPYVVEFSSATAGRIDRNTGQFEVIFEDNYGAIIFSGQYSPQMVQGTVSYQNHTAVQGYEKASGLLGSFRAYSCLIK